MTLEIIEHKQQKSASNDRSTLTLKLMGGVIRSLKQRVLVARQKMDLGALTPGVALQRNDQNIDNRSPAEHAGVLKGSAVQLFFEINSSLKIP